MTQPANVEEESEESGEGLNFRHYLLMVLERKWYAVAVFLVTMIATAVYTYRTTPMYSGVVTIQVLKRGAQVLRTVEVVESSVSSETDFNTQIRLLESLAIAQSVEARLTPEEVKLLVATGGSGEPPSPLAVIYSGRRIIPQRMTLMTNVQFLHSNPRIAARIANLYASEYIAYNSRLRTEESLKAVDELKDRAEQQRRRVDEIAPLNAACQPTDVVRIRHAHLLPAVL
jgi:uncharacterized protein involved in exopolysaccharide biosynthesis